MEIKRERRAGPQRIGELLVAARVVKPEILAEALQIAKRSKSPIGRTLMSIGMLTEQNLQAAIEVQTLLRKGIIATEFGTRALNIAVNQRISLEEAFIKLGWTPPQLEEAPESEFGELLLEAGLVSRKVLNDAFEQSQENSIPLGRCLVLVRALTPALLSSALTAQVLIRDGKISKEQAVAGLAASVQKKQPIEYSLKSIANYDASTEGMKVGELLTSAGLVTEGDRMNAIEVGLEKEKMVGEVLVQAGMISSTVLDDSLKLQKLVLEGALTSGQAAELLKQSHSKGISIETILAETIAKEEDIKRANQVIDLLSRSGIIKQEQLAQAQAASVQTNRSVGETLLANGWIQKPVVEAAIEAKNLVQDEIITTDQAVSVLLHCQKTGTQFHEALQIISSDQKQSEKSVSSGGKESWLKNLWSKVRQKN